jgi:SAM-dependent methyltransferase
MNSGVSMFLDGFGSRLTKTQEFVSDMNQFMPRLKIESKSFFRCNSIQESIQECLLYMYSRYKEPWSSNDGLIFIPSNIGYKSLLSTEQKILKYKLPSKVSIDFLIKKCGSYYILYLYNTKTKEVEPYSNHVLSEDSSYVDYNQIEDGMIIECIWYQSRFVAYRIRSDKQKPNSCQTAYHTFKDMNQPLYLNDILYNNSISSTDSMIELKKYHNSIKGNMIRLYCREKKVIDIGFGVGGDMMKYHHPYVNVKTLYGVEPNQDNISMIFQRFPFTLNDNQHFLDQTINRMISRKIDTSVKLSKTDLNKIWKKTQILDCSGDDYHQIFNILSQYEFDVVSLFFSLSCIELVKFDNLIKVIYALLKPRGKLIGIVLDGSQVVKLLGDKNEYKTDTYYIQRINDETIHFNMLDSTLSSERLIFFDNFQKRLEFRGFRLIESNLFHPPNIIKIRTEERQLSQLYRKFVFEKC